MDTIKISANELKEILKEYEYEDNVMTEDDPRVTSIKWALSQIPDADRIIYCLWLDQESSRKVGKILGVSHSTILKELKRIKNEILNLIC
jgi:DNA-directed RNA polymerase specialized sigma subunit